MFNNKTLTIGIIALFFGIVVGVAMQPEPKTIVKNEAEWKQLKEIDDLGFMLATDGIRLCTSALTAISDNDLITLEENTVRMKEIVGNINLTSNKRLEVLKKLGY